MFSLLSKPKRAALVGALLGMIFAGTRRSLCEAQATLFFPPSLVLERQPSDSSPTPAAVEPGEESVSDAVAWAQDNLTSKEAIDAVCKRIERTSSDAKTTALRSAVLLAQDQRVRVETLPDACVRLKVYAEDPKVALLLCDSLLAYLSFKTKIPLEDPDPENLVTAERQLRVQEKTLSQTLWSLLAFDSPKSQDTNALQSAELDLREYQQVVARYRQALYQHFFRETNVAATQPSFVILEPPSQIRNHRPWLESALAGSLVGIACSALLTLFGRRRVPDREIVRWRIQEPRIPKRTADE